MRLRSFGDVFDLVAAGPDLAHASTVPYAEALLEDALRDPATFAELRALAWSLEPGAHDVARALRTALAAGRLQARAVRRIETGSAGPVMGMVDLTDLAEPLTAASAEPEPRKRAKQIRVPATLTGEVAAARRAIGIARVTEKVIVVAHGSAAAESLQLMMSGDADAWAAQRSGAAAPEDQQRALQWAARASGWACDPGPLDGDLGPRSRSALRAFRIKSGSTDTGETMGVDDWKAIFAAFDLPPSTVQPTVDTWPGEDGLEVLIFPADEAPGTVGEVYDGDVYTVHTVAVAATEPDRRITFVYDLHDDGEAPDDARLCLFSEEHEHEVRFEDAHDDGGGWLSFHFEGVHTDAVYTLTMENDAGDSTLLFEDRKLDTFIDGIGLDALE